MILILIEFIFKNRFPTKKALHLVRWMIVGYSVIILLHFVLGISINSEDFAFIKRTTGPYKFVY
jgi:hypothetical protein